MEAAVCLDIDVRCQLGECPSWDQVRNVARFVDLPRGELWEVKLEPFPIARRVLSRDSVLSAAKHTATGDFLLAEDRRLVHVRPDGTEVCRFQVIADNIASRLNDGVTDSEGRFIVGSVSNDQRQGQEGLWRLEHSGSKTLIDNDLNLSNGMGFSPDDETFYNIDSIPGTVWARSYVPSTGKMGQRSVLCEIRDATPDGMAIDADGHLLIGMWGAGEVRCYSAEGLLMDRITVGPRNTTSCAFVGPEEDILLITTAAGDFLETSGGAGDGRVFWARPPTPGRATVCWRPVEA